MREHDLHKAFMTLSDMATELRHKEAYHAYITYASEKHGAFFHE